VANSHLNEEQALFIASLPDVFCDLEYAIWMHSFTNRDASLSVDSAQDAIRLALQFNYIELDNEGRIRLAESQRNRRDFLKSSEGYFEMAVYELSIELSSESGS
jgi:hypothetical protein